MPISENIGLENVVHNQTNPEVPVNSALNKLDNSLNSALSKDYSNGNITLTEEEFLENFVHLIGGTQTADRDYIVPVSFTLGSDMITIKKAFIVHHNAAGGFQVTVKTAAGSGVTLVKGDKKLLYCDGTNVLALL